MSEEMNVFVSSEDEHRILIAKHAEGIAKRVDIGSGWDRKKDLPWLEERARRIMVLIEEMK